MTAAEFWVGLRLAQPDRRAAHALADALVGLTDHDAYERETDPHVTLVPRVRLPEAVDRADLQRDLRLAGESVLRVEGLGVWPSAAEPAVVHLDVEETEEIREARSRVRAAAEAYGGAVKQNGVDPHVTLFKLPDPQTQNPPAFEGIGQVVEAADETFDGWESTFNGAFVRRCDG